MESNLGQRRQGLEEKIPDIKKTLTMVELLKSRKVSIISTTHALSLTIHHSQDSDSSDPLTTTFELNDTLWAEATLDDTDDVYLWLGVSFKPLLE